MRRTRSVTKFHNSQRAKAHVHATANAHAFYAELRKLHVVAVSVSLVLRVSVSWVAVSVSLVLRVSVSCILSLQLPIMPLSKVSHNV